MAARVVRNEGPAPAPNDVEQSMRDEGLDRLRRWSNAPGDTYDWHEHGYHKVLYCVSGGIVFHTRSDGDLELHPGDRLDVEPGTQHAASVGDEGVECVEAPR